MNAANFFVASFFSSTASSPNGTASVSLSMGPKPSRQNGSPISESAPQVRPWNAPSAYSSPVRRVCARENLIAASTLSLPELEKKTFLRRPPARSHRLAASSPANSGTWLWSIPGPRRSSSSLIASIIAGWLCPAL